MLHVVRHIANIHNPYLHQRNTVYFFYDNSKNNQTSQTEEHPHVYLPQHPGVVKHQ